MADVRTRPFPACPKDVSSGSAPCPSSSKGNAGLFFDLNALTDQ
ncbi:hypothetical protein B4135_3422 [Caldibacillus debilis]|uniref:Uncharacterized protein n=1 Tax=Caldibacillus debilis TaxID=301148 RepID=A0A150LE47_9BACI|nr:hypothetical protein B4135_3422 [Caldibacillus debilis]